MEALKNLDCGRVFYYFEEICKIPHGSSHEMALSDYIVRFAEERGLYCRQDDRYNVVIKKSGSAGCEAAPPLIVQGHIDMVCEKNADVVHDFQNDPLDLYIDGDFIRARGTTLGADNGIAERTCLRCWRTIRSFIRRWRLFLPLRRKLAWAARRTLTRLIWRADGS